MKSFILIAASLLQTVFAAPQLISFKDGRVGVNFLGYHAEAGLGGGEDGGLLGGLHASAGTPFGQNAAAGLGGNVNGRAAGLLYAGAQATPNVGASAVLGGDTSRGGFSGTDAYANGKVASRTHTIESAGNTPYSQQHHQQQDNAEAVMPPQPVTENSNVIQKIRPPKKYYSPERYDFINTGHDDDKTNNNGIALYTNKTRNLYDIKQQQPASTFIAKSINKTTISTPFPTAAIGVENPITIETAAQEQHTQATTPLVFGQQLFSNDADAIKNSHNYETHTNTALNIENTATSLYSSLLEPTIISNLSFSNSNDYANDDNSNGKIAIPSAVIIRERFQLRNRKHRNQHHQHQQQHHHYHHQGPQHPKRIHLNPRQQQRQRQRSKVIVKVLEQEQQQPLLQHQPEELLIVEPKQQLPQIYHQQQHAVRRQFIAPQPSASPEYPAPPCEVSKSGCAKPNFNRPVRSDVVQNALQIPIGILQSIQASLGNLAAAPAKGY